MNVSTATIVVIAIALVALAVAVAWTVASRRRRTRLRERFGPEYDRAVAARGEPAKAEAELEKREKRVEKLHIRPVPADLRERFVASWRHVQARFVDEPGAAVAEADGLVRKVMESRGYPMGSFEQRAADISVDHPRVVENYRAAHAIAERRGTGENVSTEDLRQAFVHYRALFEELLEAPELAEVHRG